MNRIASRTFAVANTYSVLSKHRENQLELAWNCAGKDVVDHETEMVNWRKFWAQVRQLLLSPGHEV